MRQNRHEPVLPTLSGVSLLRSDDPTGPLASLAVDRLLTDDGAVWWADAGGHARTDVLARVAPSAGLLDRVRVARAFTATQHASLLRTLERRVTPEAALVVCPAVDARYRDGDLPGGEPSDLLGGAADRLARIAATGVPVLLTLRAEDQLSAAVARVVDERIEHESTRFGPRFAGEGFETLVYPRRDGTVQTTLAFWARVLERRASAVADAGTPTGAGTRLDPKPAPELGAGAGGSY
jgi:hypothetical protein